MKINLKNVINKGGRNPGDFINLIANLPKMVKLIYRLFKDSRTPFHLKIILVLAVVYVLSPIDLIPDLLIPILGQVDDLIIVIAALRYFMRKCPPELVAEHVQALEMENVK